VDAMSDHARDEVIARLSCEFRASLPASVVTEVVDQCADHLHGTPASALPELLERLARQRLTFLDTVPAWVG
jgi:hypothetical protein